MLPSSEAELSTPFRELANEDWLLVERPDVALDGKTQALYHLLLRPADTALASEDRATSCERLPNATSAHFGRAEVRSPAAPCGANLPDPRPRSRQGVSASTSPMPRRIASAWAMTVDVSATGCPATPMLPPRLENVVDHSRRRKRETRPESSPDLPSRNLVPYRLDTPPSSPVTQRRRRLVSCENDGITFASDRACPDEPACSEPTAPASPTSTGDGHQARCASGTQRCRRSKKRVSTQLLATSPPGNDCNR